MHIMFGKEPLQHRILFYAFGFYAEQPTLLSRYTFEQFIQLTETKTMKKSYFE